MRFGFRFTGLALMTLLLPACSEQACYDEKDPLVNISLFESGTGVTKKATSLEITGLGDTSVIALVKAASVSNFSVPLNPGEETSVMVITLNGFTDTAIFSYSNYIHLVSPECGYTFFSVIKGLNTTHNIIDSIIIENKNITVDGERNMRLFY